MAMQIVLFRHAEKSSVGAQNPGLSARGHAQANLISNLASQGELPSPTRFLSSPLLRAQQTLLPASQKFEKTIEIVADLNERQNLESVDQFRHRISRFLRWVETQTGLLYVCSHLDWIDEAMSLITSDVNLNQDRYQHWSPAAHLCFEIDASGLWVLEKQGEISL